MCVRGLRGNHTLMAQCGRHGTSSVASHGFVMMAARDWVVTAFSVTRPLLEHVVVVYGIEAEAR